MSSERAALKKDHAEEERELLRLLLQKEGLSSAGWEITSPETRERLPLSWAQKRLWFLDRLQPGSDFYNVVLACDLHGDLNVPALERSRQEMALLYAAYVQGQEPPLKEMPIQYADYTMWQAQWFKGEVFAGQMEYWKRQLAGMPEVLELPTDKPRLAMSEHRGSMETALL